MQIVGLIPFKSLIAHPIAPFYFLSTLMSWSSWTYFKLELIIAGHCSSVSRKIYLRFSGSCFNFVPFFTSYFSSGACGGLKFSHSCGFDLFHGGCASNIASTLKQPVEPSSNIKSMNRHQTFFIPPKGKGEHQENLKRVKSQSCDREIG